MDGAQDTGGDDDMEDDRGGGDVGHGTDRKGHHR